MIASLLTVDHQVGRRELEEEDDEMTHIVISMKHKKKLRRLGNIGDTYDDALGKLFDLVEKEVKNHVT